MRVRKTFLRGIYRSLRRPFCLFGGAPSFGGGFVTYPRRLRVLERLRGFRVGGFGYADGDARLRGGAVEVVGLGGDRFAVGGLCLRDLEFRLGDLPFGERLVSESRLDLRRVEDRAQDALPFGWGGFAESCRIALRNVGARAERLAA